MEHLLEHHGIKPTANRLLIVKALEKAGRPLSLTELETTLETIDKSNISRALSLFREAHLVHVLEDSGDGCAMSFATPMPGTTTTTCMCIFTARAVIKPIVWKIRRSLRFLSPKVSGKIRSVTF